MSAEQEYFRVGDRVKLSDLGMQRMPRNKSTTAKVVQDDLKNTYSMETE